MLPFQEPLFMGYYVGVCVQPNQQPLLSEFCTLPIFTISLELNRVVTLSGAPVRDIYIPAYFFNVPCTGNSNLLFQRPYVSKLCFARIVSMLDSV